jgi:hypothetical protein
MSHNKIKVGGQEPNASGEVSVALDTLSDVSTSPTAMLKYVDGWTSGLPPFEASDYGLIASNQTTGAVSTTYTTSTRNSVITDSRASGYGRIEGTGVTQVIRLYQSGTTSGGTNQNRYFGLELPANAKFLLIYVHTPIFSNSTGQTVLQWVDENDNPLGHQVQLTDGGRGSKKMFGYIETGASAVKVFGTCISTNNHRLMNKSDGDSWQAIRIG